MGRSEGMAPYRALGLALAFAFACAFAGAEPLPLPLPGPGTAATAATGAGAPVTTAPVTVTLAFDVSELTPDSTFTATLTLAHAEGWHTYAKPAGDAGLPTSVEWSLSERLSAGDIEWPTPRTFVDRGVKSYGYEDTVTLKIPMRADASVRAGSTVRIAATIRYLACKEACEPGSASFEYELPVVAGTQTAGTGTGDANAADTRTAGTNAAADTNLARLLVAILGAFLGGLILNLMPCVLPVLSLKLHSLVLMSASGRRESIRNALAYAIGILVSFWALAGILAALRTGGNAVGWGFQFQNPRFVAAMAVFFMAFALNMLGIFEIGEGAEALAEKAVPREGLPRAFVSGVVATVAATPCTAPFMGAAIAYALSASPLAAFLVFGSMGAGLASPVVVLSLVPSLASHLPRAGRWMETLKHVLGFALMGTVVWLLSILTALAASPMPALSGLLVAGIAAWTWGRWGGADSTDRTRRTGRAVAAILFAASVAFAAAFTADAQNTDAWQAGTGAQQAGTGAQAANAQPSIARTASESSAQGIQWEPWSASRLDELRAEGTTVFVDFGADWCLTCVANDTAVLGRKAVADAFARRGAVALKADWTRSDPEITRALAMYGRTSVPLYLVFKPGDTEPTILPEILTERVVLDAILTP